MDRYGLPTLPDTTDPSHPAAVAEAFAAWLADATPADLRVATEALREAAEDPARPAYYRHACKRLLPALDLWRGLW